MILGTNMNIETPTGWRKGQTIFNFLWWLKDNKNVHSEMVHEGEAAQTRMADPFHIPDVQIDEWYKEFMDTYAELKNEIR